MNNCKELIVYSPASKESVIFNSSKELVVYNFETDKFISQKLKEFRQIWINGLRDGYVDISCHPNIIAYYPFNKKKGIQEIVWYSSLWRYAKSIDSSVFIITDEESIDIFLYHCKRGKIYDGINIVNMLDNLSSEKIYFAYKRMIFECKKEFVKTYLISNMIPDRCKQMLLLALIETNWDSKSDINKLDMWCWELDNLYLNKMLKHIFSMELKSSLRYFLNNYKIDRITETYDILEFCYGNVIPLATYPFMASYILQIFLINKCSYQPMIHLCLDLCKNNENFLSQLSDNLYDETHLFYLNIQENILKSFIWFMIEIDFFKYIPKKLRILQKIMNNYYSGDVICEHLNHKNKINDDIDNILHPITKEVINVIKEYIVYYENMMNLGACC